MMEQITGVAGGALNIFIIIFVGVFVILIVGATIFLLMKTKQYKEFRCVIWQRDGFGQLTEKYDRAGVFVDSKTHNKRLFLKKANVGLNPDNIPYVPTSRGRKIIYLLQTGLKNFHYIKPSPSNPAVYLSVGEEDVNWAINAYERNKQMFQQSWLMQYLPFMALAFVTIVIMIIFIYFFKNFDVLQQLGTDLKEAAAILAQGRAGTTVIT